MSRTRREAIRAALASAVVAATPTSLVAASRRVEGILVPLADGSQLEIAAKQVSRVKSGVKSPVRSGTFDLKGGGKLVVENGLIKEASVTGRELFIEFKMKLMPDPTQPSTQRSVREFIIEDKARNETLTHGG
jgi:hypothetical protein